MSPFKHCFLMVLLLKIAALVKRFVGDDARTLNVVLCGPLISEQRAAAIARNVSAVCVNT